ncbi:hypothetical protein AOE01nite_20670 [Acetobacter oeni]|uniref:Uncharacterized protein n=1 Tax=Acetobacter oeni TaxID=304077 RepID=A0A511XLM1_9PROT|nr:hypothetical protein AOE01nite_20670 [Acetobacter oeni]
MGGRTGAFFYMGGDPPWECFQVNIKQPANCEIVVWAFIDTNDDAGHGAILARSRIGAERDDRSGCRHD